MKHKIPVKTKKVTEMKFTVCKQYLTVQIETERENFDLVLDFLSHFKMNDTPVSEGLILLCHQGKVDL